jgi:hypothetical protein
MKIILFLLLGNSKFVANGYILPISVNNKYVRNPKYLKTIFSNCNVLFDSLINFGFKKLSFY